MATKEDLRYKFQRGLPSHFRRLNKRVQNIGLLRIISLCIVRLSLSEHPIRSIYQVKNFRGVGDKVFEILKVLEKSVYSSDPPRGRPNNLNTTSVLSSVLVSLLEYELENGQSRSFIRLKELLKRAFYNLEDSIRKHINFANEGEFISCRHKLGYDISFQLNVEEAKNLIKFRKRHGEDVVELLEAGKAAAQRLRNVSLGIDKENLRQHFGRMFENKVVDSGDVTLIIDHREGGGLESHLGSFCALLTKKQVRFYSAGLRVGDYQFFYKEKTAPIFIERKEITDLADSITDGRYEAQKTRMLEEAQKLRMQCALIYILEGDLARTAGRFKCPCGKKCVAKHNNPSLEQLQNEILRLKNDSRFHVKETSNVIETINYLTSIWQDLNSASSFDKICDKAKMFTWEKSNDISNDLHDEVSDNVVIIDTDDDSPQKSKQGLLSTFEHCAFWECTKCTLVNSKDDICCNACFTTKFQDNERKFQHTANSNAVASLNDRAKYLPNVNKDSFISLVDTDDEESLLEHESVPEIVKKKEAATQLMKPKLSHNQWECIHCTYINEAEGKKCEICGVERHKSNGNDLAYSEGKLAKVKHSEKRNDPYNPGKCEFCMYNSDAELEGCKICTRGPATFFKQSPKREVRENGCDLLKDAGKKWKCSRCGWDNLLTQIICSLCDNPPDGHKNLHVDSTNPILTHTPIGKDIRIASKKRKRKSTPPPSGEKQPKSPTNAELKERLRLRGEKHSSMNKQQMKQALKVPKKPQILIDIKLRGDWVPMDRTGAFAMLIVLDKELRKGNSGRMTKDDLMEAAEHSGLSKESMYGRNYGATPFQYDGWSQMTKVVRGGHVPKVIRVPKSNPAEYELSRSDSRECGVNFAAALHYYAHQRHYCSCNYCPPTIF